MQTIPRINLIIMIFLLIEIEINSELENVNTLLKLNKLAINVDKFNMYCSTMWYNCTVTAMKRLRIDYNNSHRRLLGKPKQNSASGMFVQLNIKSFL